MTLDGLIKTTAVAALIAVSTASAANAWQRNGTVTGWRGTASVNASGSCYGGTCSRNVTRTGPYGYSMNRQGSVSCAGGTCSGSRTTTGPYGGTITRQGTVTRY